MSEDDWHAKYDTMNKMYNTLLHNHAKLIDWVLENQREEIIALLLRDAA